MIPFGSLLLLPPPALLFKNKTKQAPQEVQLLSRHFKKKDAQMASKRAMSIKYERRRDYSTALGVGMELPQGKVREGPGKYWPCCFLIRMLVTRMC